MIPALAFLTALVASAAAHSTFQEIWINGVDAGNSCARLPLSNSPVQSVTTPDLACNVGTSPVTGVCIVKPGDSVTVEMHAQPNDRTCANEAIGGAHYGPVIVYMAPVTDATTAVGSAAKWFKVSEIGMPSNNPDYWGTDVLNANCGHYTFTVPAGIKPGDYLLRAEVIALHVASSTGGAQFYMTCFQLSVGGTGTVSPSGVAIPGAYSATDPGILIDIHQSLKAYTIPGPTVYASASPTVAATPYPTTATWNTAAQPTAVPTSVSGIVTTRTLAPAPTGSTGAGTVPQFGQCGGIGWTGATGCVAPYKCTAQGAYYSQCV